MTQTLDAGGMDELVPPLPAHLAVIARPELPSLAEEIITEIRRTIPEYARPIDGPYGQTLRLGVDSTINGFFDKVFSPGASQDSRDEMCRRLGRFEAQEGRSLDVLQAAYRVGIQVAWRRVMRVGRRHNLPSSVMTRLADILFGYMDELASLSLEGYLEAKAECADETKKRRQRLLCLVLERPAVSETLLAEQAELAGWSVPAEVSMVAVRSGGMCTRSLLDEDVLYDLDCPEPYLLIPGALTADRRAMVEGVLEGSPAAVGPTVPLEQAAHSLRWARQALVLASEGVIDDGALTLCEDHLITLWLMADAPLIDQIARRRLIPMADLTTRQRGRLIDTLRTWLATRGTAAQIADHLEVHPQTVRYRIRQLERTLGKELSDPDTRFSIEVALRAIWLRERGARRRADVARSGRGGKGGKGAKAGKSGESAKRRSAMAEPADREPAPHNLGEPEPAETGIESERAAAAAVAEPGTPGEPGETGGAGGAGAPGKIGKGRSGQPEAGVVEISEVKPGMAGRVRIKPAQRSKVKSVNRA